MEPNVATALHSITDFGSPALLQASSDAVPHANGYLDLQFWRLFGQGEMT